MVENYENTEVAKDKITIPKIEAIANPLPICLYPKYKNGMLKTSMKIPSGNPK